MAGLILEFNSFNSQQESSFEDYYSYLSCSNTIIERFCNHVWFFIVHLLLHTSRRMGTRQRKKLIIEKNNRQRMGA